MHVRIPETRREWIEIGIAAGLSFLFFRLSIFFFLFLIPLHIVWQRRGGTGYFWSSLLCIAFIGISSYIRLRGVENPGGIVMLDSLLGFVFIIGLYIADSDFFPSTVLPFVYDLKGTTAVPGSGYPTDAGTGDDEDVSRGTGEANPIAGSNGPRRTLWKLLAATVFVGIISLVVILFMMRDERVTEAFRAQIEQVMTMFQPEAVGSESLSAEGELQGIDIDSVVIFVRKTLLRNYLAGYFMVLSAVWLLGRKLGERYSMIQSSEYEGLSALDTASTYPPHRGRFVVERFSLPDSMIWPLLLSWAGVLADVTVGLGFIGYVVWNIGLITLFLFGIQGFGILRWFLVKRRVTKGVRRLIYLSMVMLFFIPGANFLLVLGVPGLGISEVWIKYRIASTKGKGD